MERRGRGRRSNILVTMSILSSMEFVWFKAVLADELLGPPSRLWTPTCEEVSGEKNPPKGSIPKASRWPVSLIVRPVFLDFFTIHSSAIAPNFLNLPGLRKFKSNKGNKEPNTRVGKENTPSSNTDLREEIMFARFGGGSHN